MSNSSAPPLRISTPRLDLVAATATIARADASDRGRFAEVLEAEIPDMWPPAVMADVQDHFAEQLEKGFAMPGWWSWYGVLRRQGRNVLIGNVGLAGQPDDEGTVTMGYSVVAGFEGAGYATEMVRALIGWMKATGRVKRVLATTFVRHFASIKVLERNGFMCRGVSSEDAAASEADRQGRGALMLYALEPLD